jgi:hypothetical protein
MPQVLPVLVAQQRLVLAPERGQVLLQGPAPELGQVLLLAPELLQVRAPELLQVPALQVLGLRLAPELLQVPALQVLGQVPW